MNHFLKNSMVQNRFYLIWALAMTATVYWMTKPRHFRSSKGHAALVTSMIGQVEIKPPGEFTWFAASQNTEVQSYDVIATGKKSQATLTLEGGYEIHLPEMTQVKILPPSVNNGLELALLDGSLKIMPTVELSASSQVNKDKRRSQPNLKISTKSHVLRVNALNEPLALVEGKSIQTRAPEKVTIETSEKSYLLAANHLDSHQGEKAGKSTPIAAPLVNYTLPSESVTLSSQATEVQPPAGKAAIEGASGVSPGGKAGKTSDAQRAQTVHSLGSALALSMVQQAVKTNADPKRSGVGALSDGSSPKTLQAALIPPEVNELQRKTQDLSQLLKESIKTGTPTPEVAIPAKVTAKPKEAQQKEAQPAPSRSALKAKAQAPTIAKAPPSSVLVPQPKDFPRLERSQRVYWYGGSLDEQMQGDWEFALEPSSLAIDLPDAWQSFVQISRAGSAKKTKVPFRTSGSLLRVDAAALRPLVLAAGPSPSSIELKVQIGIETPPAQKILGDGIAQVVLRKLTASTPQTLYLDRWSPYSESARLILAKSLPSLRPVHFYQPDLLTNIERILSNSAFTLAPLRQPIGPTLIYGVRKSKIVVAVHSGDRQLVLDQFARFGLDLVFEGQADWFLGNQTNADFVQLLGKSEDLFYARRGQTLKIDKDLFKSHAAAQDFIRSFKPYFFARKVVILKQSP